MSSSEWNHEEIQAMRMQMQGAYRGYVPKQLEWYGLHNMNCVVWLVEQGHGRIETAHQTIELIHGTWVFHMPGLHLNQIFSPDTRLISIRFRLHWSSGRSLFNSQQVRTVPDHSVPDLKQAALGLLRFLPSYSFYERPQSDFSSPDQIWARDAAERHFLSRWYRIVCDCGFEPQAEQISDKRVQRAVAVLKQSLSLRDVPYDDVCAELHLSRAQLDRIFIEHLGHSPKREHDLLRLAHVQQELQQTDRAVKQIARDIGFHDASQFTKWFRRLDGRSPGHARNAAHGPV